jgi:hypothetical protein
LRTSNKSFEILKKPNTNFSKESKKEYERLLLISLYQSLYKEEKISVEQLMFLENINRKSCW